MNEINQPANLPNSYHSSQTDTVTKSDTHGSSEQTIHTETCRITETTLRMEHKSPLPDIQFNPSPRPFEIKENIDIYTNTNTNTNTMTSHDNSKMIPLIDIELVPQHQPNYTEHDNLIANRTFENIKYKTYKTATANETTNLTHQHLHDNVTAINDNPLINTNSNSVSDRIKTIEKSTNDETIFKTIPKWNTNVSNESPITQYGFDKQSQRAISITPTFNTSSYQNGISIPNPLTETIEEFSTKIQGYEQNHWSTDYELKAPALVKHVTPIIKSNENGIQSQTENVVDVPVNLQPGEPPELCFAPRMSGERRQSFVEKIEKTLEKELERGPSKVIPHSVRLMPPSPQTTSTEHYESNQRIVKQIKQQNINQTNHEINNIKNIFYEHNKPIQKHTIDFVPTPTKAPEKVRNLVMFSVCAQMFFFFIVDSVC